jgi:hypothetical protein
MDQEWIMRQGSASYWCASDGELKSTESQNILLVKRDLALHNGAKASIVSLTFAEVAELVDAHDSGSCGGHLVEVRVLSSALSSFDKL